MTFEELINDEEFVDRFSNVTNAQEVVSLFADKGIQVSQEVAQEVFDRVADTELSADDLDGVAGGGWVGERIAQSVAFHAMYIVYRSKGYSVAQARAMAKKRVYG